MPAHSQVDAAEVLIVEDNPANLMLARVVLQRAGYLTVEARSAEEALERLSSARPDLILLDIQLPGEDGLSLVRRLRADPATADLPIVAVTAHAMTTDRKRALEAGCDGYVSKPIDTRRLAEQIQAVLHARGRGLETVEVNG